MQSHKVVRSRHHFILCAKMVECLFSEEFCTDIRRYVFCIFYVRVCSELSSCDAVAAAAAADGMTIESKPYACVHKPLDTAQHTILNL